MGRSSANLSSMVFKGVVKGNIGQLSLDGRMLSVLMELDGKKDLASVARSLQMTGAMLKKVIKHLYQKKLIIRIEKAIPFIDRDFFDFLQAQLSRAVGPIAEILIEDEIEEISDNPTGIPSDLAAELVELLARQIPREEKKLQFQKVMIEKIKSKGY